MAQTIKVKITKDGVSSFIQPLTVEAAKVRLTNELEACGCTHEVASMAAHSLAVDQGRTILAGNALFERFAY